MGKSKKHQKKLKEQREQEQREREQREHEQREQEQREQEQREQEQREREQREQEQREQEQREQEPREQEQHEQTKEQHIYTENILSKNHDNDSDSDSDSDKNSDSDTNSDSGSENNSDDMSLDGTPRRHKRPKINDWAKNIIDHLVKTKDREIKTALQSKIPDFPKIEKIFRNTNKAIKKANEQHGVFMDDNLLPEKVYQINYNAWSDTINSEMVNGDRLEGWKRYHQLHHTIALLNREHNLPKEWNFPPDVTRKKFGKKPADLAPPEIDDNDSATENSHDSDRKENESGIDALETRSHKLFKTTSRGTVRYWWECGTGNQIFVQYGSPEAPIYRVRAGSSGRWSKKLDEKVLPNTRGNQTVVDSDGKVVWAHGRDKVKDIIGVGWKVEDDKDVSYNALAPMRPGYHKRYPPTRVLVHWKDGYTSLEGRPFVRRIADNDKLNGDRIIYTRARELESAFWGFDVDESWDLDSDDGNDILTDEPRKYHAHSSRNNQRRYAQVESDSNSDTSQSSSEEERPKKRPIQHFNKRKGRHSNKSADIEAQISVLMKELKQLQVTERNSHRGKRR